MELVHYAVEVGALGDANLPYCSRSANMTAWKSKGVANGFRIRVGNWPVSYTLDREGGRMSVFEIAARGGAYR
jgi:hypothetical protein